MGPSDSTLVTATRNATHEPVVNASLGRVLVVSPDGAEVTRIRRLLGGPGSTRIEATRDVEAAVNEVASESHDVVLVAIESLDPHDLGALALLCERAPRAAVLVLVSREDDVPMVEAIRRGAQDVLVRSELDAGHLRRACRCARERVRQLAALRELAMTDPLTGLYNRRGFMKIAEAHGHALRRTGRTSLLIYADLDGLKRVNDRHGHAVGDRALVVAARALRRALRESDAIARYGGDEFTAIAQGADTQGAARLVARIATAMGEERGREGLPSMVSLSVGATPFAPERLTLEDILLHADRALYDAKRRSGTHAT